MSASDSSKKEKLNRFFKNLFLFSLNNIIWFTFYKIGIQIWMILIRNHDYMCVTLGVSAKKLLCLAPFSYASKLLFLGI